MSKIVFLKGVTDHQMMSVVLLTPNHTVVIDGGMPTDAENLASFLLSQKREGVDAWFFTHPHQDHIGAFLSLIKSSPSVLKGQVYCNFPAMEVLETVPAHSEGERELWREMHRLLKTTLSGRVHFLKREEAFFFDEVSLLVPWTFDPAVSFPKNFVNNSSSVFLVKGNTASVLIPGDLGEDGGEAMLSVISPEALFASYTQMSHHGQLGLSRKAYEAIRPCRCIWPTPEKIWFNVGENGPGSGPWCCSKTYGWMENLGVSEHYFTKDGNVILEV